MTQKALSHSTLSSRHYIVLRSRLGDILLATRGIAPKSSIYPLQNVDKERACVTNHSAHHGLVPRPREGSAPRLRRIFRTRMSVSSSLAIVSWEFLDRYRDTGNRNHASFSNRADCAHQRSTAFASDAGPQKSPRSRNPSIQSQ